MYQKRRDSLVDSLDRAGWKIAKPKGTMFVWAEIPEPAKKMGSVEFSKFLLQEAKVAVSPGIGFGQYGDDHVRFVFDRKRTPYQAGGTQYPPRVRQAARLNDFTVREFLIRSFSDDSVSSWHRQRRGTKSVSVCSVLEWSARRFRTSSLITLRGRWGAICS